MMSEILIVDLPRSVQGYCSDSSSYLHTLGFRLGLTACIEHRDDELRSIKVRIGKTLVSSSVDIVVAIIDGEEADLISRTIAADAAKEKGE